MAQKIFFQYNFEDSVVPYHKIIFDLYGSLELRHSKGRSQRWGVRSWKRDILAALATCGAWESSSMCCWLSPGLRNGTCGGLLELAKAIALTLKALENTRELGFQRFLECSVLIPAPTKWRESYSSGGFFQGWKHDCGVSANAETSQNWRLRRLLLSWTSKDRRDALSRRDSTEWPTIFSGAIHFLGSFVICQSSEVSPATGKCDVDVATAVMKGSYSWKASHRFRVCKAWGETCPGASRGPCLSIFLPSWWTNISNTELRCS